MIDLVYAKTILTTPPTLYNQGEQIKVALELIAEVERLYAQADTVTSVWGDLDGRLSTPRTPVLSKDCDY